MREWLSWWSTTLPRSGPRVRVPSRALKKRDTSHDVSLFFESCRTRSFEFLRSAPVRAEQTSTGCLASPFRSGRCLTASTGRWLLRSASVGAEQTSTGHRASSLCSGRCNAEAKIIFPPEELIVSVLHSVSLLSAAKKAHQKAPNHAF